MPYQDPIKEFGKKLRQFKYFFQNVVLSMGYSTIGDWITKFFIPITFLSFLVLGTLFFLSNLPKWWLIIWLMIYVGFIVIYPLKVYFGKILDIKSHLFFFITYVTSLSTLQISRTLIFKRVSQNKKFGFLSELAERLVYFSKAWNLGFSTAARKVKKLIPHKGLQNFFERLATISDFGEDVETFFLEEQDAIVDDIVAEHNRTYEYIRMIQEVFVSIIITFSFVMVLLMLLPILTGNSLEGLIKILAMIIFTIDLSLVLIVRFIIPKDNLMHDLPITSDLAKKVHLSFLFSLPLTGILLAVLSYLFLPRLPFLIVVALSLTPLFIPAYLANELENKIVERDQAFPPFIRTFGGALEAKGGGMLSTMEGLLVQDFGPIQDIFERLYVRLKLGNDKYASWLYFGGESDSNLIYNFSQIFAETVYLGGNAEKIAEVISKNMQKILGLRKMKLQLVSGLRGALYGALVGFASAGYIGIEVSARLASIFSLPLEAMQNAGGEFLGGLFPQVPEVNVVMLSTYIGIMIIIHAFFSSYLLKMLDGGHKYAMFFDLIIMIWIGAILSWAIPFIVTKLLPAVTATASSLFTTI